MTNLTSKRRRRKLSDADISNARNMVMTGQSIRSVARFYKVDHRGLMRRIARLFGDDYKDGSHTVELLSEYANCNDPKLAAAAKEFLSRYKPTKEKLVFFSSKKEQNLSIADSYLTYNPDTFLIKRSNGRCKVA